MVAVKSPATQTDSSNTDRGPAGVPSAQRTIPESWKVWDSFLETAPATGFMQSSWWARFRNFVGFEYFGAVLQDQHGPLGGGLVAKVDFAEDRYFYYIQDGPVLPSNEAQARQVFAALLDYLEQRRRAEGATISHLRIEPRWAQIPEFVEGFQTPDFEDRYREPYHTLCIDLQPSEEAILAQMKPKGRYNIKLAQRHGVRVMEDSSEQGLSDFYRIYRSMAQRQKIGRKPLSYFRNLLGVMLTDQKAAVFVAEYAGRRIAAALVVYFGGRATYFYGGSLAIYRWTMAPYLLHFEIMRGAKAKGCHEYDFWGIAPLEQDHPNHPWHGFSSFKRKFGGYDVARPSKLDLVYDQAAYQQYKELEGWS